MRTYPPDYRKTEVDAIFTRWARSKSVSMIGVGSVGKSNLVQHLFNLIHERNSASAQVPLLAIVLDANLLPRLPSDNDALRVWAGLELIMHRLYLTAYPFEMLGSEAEVLFKTYQRLQDGSNPLYALMGLRYLELALELFFRRGYKIVLIFDEFELFLEQMPIQFFLNLRGLRDMHKSQLSYMLFSRAPLNRLCDRFDIDALTIEPFTELFTDNEYYLGPYQKRDATFMLREMAANNQMLSDDAVNYLYSVSGGFAGLLRSCAELITYSSQGLTQWPIAKLVTHKSVKSECDVILRALDHKEINALRVAIGASDADVDQETVDLLVAKRLLTIDASGALTVQPPLLAAHLKQM